MILRRGRLWADRTTEGNTVAACSWLGLPNFPCWLWLRPEYRVLVEGAGLTNGAYLEPMGDGALLRCSETPAKRPAPTEIGIDPHLVRPGHQFDAPAAACLPETAWLD